MTTFTMPTFGYSATNFSFVAPAPAPVAGPTQPVKLAKKQKAKPVKFSTLNPTAAMKYSEPQRIVALFFNSQTSELKAVGEDGNVRVCKTNRMEAKAAQELMMKLKAVRDEQGIICFEAAGGFSPDKWFCDIVQS